MNGFIVTSILFSILNIGICFLFARFYPKEVNDIIGYRTRRSMRSKEAWDVANRFSSQLMLRCAFILFLVQLPLYLVFEGDIAMILFILLWLGCLLTIIYVTERKLKKDGF